MKKVHVHQYKKCVAIAVLAGLLATLVVSASAKSPIPKQKSSGLVTVRGTVVNADGKPVYGVKGVAEIVGPDGKPLRDRNGYILNLAESDYHYWSSGNGGKFVIRVRPGTYQVYAQDAMSRAVILKVPRGKSSVSVRVLAGLPAGYVKVHGSVVTLDGAPKAVNGRTMDISGKGAPWWASDKEGKFSIDLKPGTYRLWTVGAKSKAVTLIVPKGKSPVSVKVIAKPTGNHVPVKFLSPDGRPAVNALLRYGISTDGKGMVMLNIDDDAPIRLFFATSVGYANVDITDDEELFRDEPIIVRLSAGHYVSGRVSSEPGDIPLGGVKVYPSRVYKEDDPWNRWNSQFGFACDQYTINEEMSATSRDGVW